MNRFYKALVATFLTIMLLPLGHKAYANWTPHEKYAKWINTFAVDKIWQFDNSEGSASGNVNNGCRLVDHPGTIAWCFMSWDERNKNSDDHNMDWFNLYLSDVNNHSDCYLVAYIDIDNSDDNNAFPGLISNYHNAKTWCVQMRWYSQDDGSWWLYMVTEYSPEMRNYIEKKGANLCVNAYTRWDNEHWATYDEYSGAVAAADRTFISLAAPSVSSPEWMVQVNKTAVKYTRNIPASGCDLRITETCNGKTGYTYDYTSVNTGSETAYLYPFEVSPKPSMANMDGQPISYTFDLRKTYTANQQYYTYRGGKTGCPNKHFIYSPAVTLTPPKFAQPKNLQITNKNDGSISVNWEIANTDDDKSDFILERSSDANFSSVTLSERIKLVAGKTQYSFTDKFTERNQGVKDFYYRVHREHAMTKDLNVISKKISVNTNYLSIAKVDAEPTTEGNIKLTWEVNSGIWDKNTMTIQLYHDGILFKTFSDGLTTAYTMTESLSTCDPHIFTVSVWANTAEQNRSNSEPIVLPEKNIGVITGVKSSCGYFNNHVVVNWTTDAANNNFHYFHIIRSEYGSEDATESLGTVNTVMGLTEYSFDDKTCVPGTYYLYSIQGFSECNGNVQMQASKSDIGFAQPFGVISGQITYEGNQGVNDVAVHAVGDGSHHGSSLYFKKDLKPELVFPAEMLKQMLDENEGTIEFYEKCEGEIAFRHIAVSYKGKDIKDYYINGVRQSDFKFPNGIPLHYNSSWQIDSDWKVGIFNDSGEETDGFIDEIRIWNIYRDSAEIAKTMHCYLNGIESGLKGYYRCDDNVPNHLFDISRTGNTYNAHHLTMNNVIFDADNIPTTEQLSLRGYTDQNGHYLINNIPYSVNGTLYNVIPTLGIHEFNPSSRPLFFNGDATTHNSIDFTDVSSFPVSGFVYYEGTDYPVEGCNFYVDGNACAMDNKLVESASDGSFTISVPIGDHYIEVRKANHTFMLGGRYPESIGGNKTTINFQQPMSNLTFYDNTLVTLTGRVAGGTIQDSLPHGMQLGKANIGKARVVISPETKEKYNLNTSEIFERNWNRPDSCMVNSTAYTPAKSGSRGMRIAIDTDPMTGEFSVLVPPIDMTVDSISIPSNPDIVFDLGSFEKMELSKVGDAYLQTDSVFVDSVNSNYFKYTAKLDAIYRVNPELIITDTQHDNGMMGIRHFVISDAAHDTAYTVNIFEYDSVANQWKYNFEVPYFLQGNTYVWHLHAFEQYVNLDQADAVVYDSVPVKHSIVTLYNELGTHLVVDRDTVIVSSNGDSIHYSAGEMALEENQIELDSTGCAYYRFSAGDPLKSAPHRLGLTVTFTDSEQKFGYDWSQNGKFQGVIMGSISDGSNFITEGPDHVVYVLRDPPGGGSHSVLKAGSKITHTSITTSSGHWSDETGLVSNFGVGSKLVSGMGIMVIMETKAKDELTTLAKYSGHRDHVHTETTTYTTTRDISTESDVYHVGSSGDVYIGYSTNRVFGEATMITLMRDTVGNYYLGSKPVITVGERFDTDFAFSQTQLEKTQIPNLIKLRDALLETVTTAEYDTTTLNTGSSVRYITTLNKNASNFGAIGTYKALKPLNMPLDTIEQDMVLYYNNQIDNWEKRIADNERSKVGMLEDCERKLIKNVSIDGGVTLTESATTSSSSNDKTAVYHGFNINIKNKLGFEINETGEQWIFDSNGGGDWGEGDEDADVKDTSVTYTFDLNPYEQLSVNIYDTGDGNSPAFSVVGGQTSCPYEGEEKTKYYEPGQYTLNTATQKLQEPLIRVEGTSAYSAIPVGGEATYTIQMSNQSPTLPPMTFALRLMEESNPDGAQLLVDGLPLDAVGTTYHFSGNNMITKSITLKQGKPDVMEYKNIGIILSSECTARSVADTCFVSATFIAACSDISLSVETRVVNDERNGKLPMTISDYDYNLPTLTGCRLQYKQPMETNWHLIQEFDKNEMKNGSVRYTWDMTELNDGDYEVRAVTVCDLGGQEVINESEVIPIVKDITPPEALGLPSPINGIYTVDNQIYVDFNKNIQTGRIISSCVDVNGVLNAHEQTHSVGLLYDGLASYTEAEYNLSGTDFSFETWINWTEGGTLLSHTADGLKLFIQDDGHLSISIDSKQWVSQQVMPKNKWLYFLFNYKQSASGMASVSAHCAYDDQTIDLFSNTIVPYYDHRGMLFIADEALAAKMHDAIFWSTSRDWATALSERNKSKDAYTDGIVSFWPMNEGEGIIAHDVVRHRNLTLGSSTMWWYNNENKALHIPANTEAVLDFSRVPDSFGDDYLFSFWFRTEATHEVPFFRTSNGSLTTWIDGSTFVMETKDGVRRFDMGVKLNDGAWHHFAISSSHSFSPTVLIDGEIRNIATMDRQVFISEAIIFSNITATDAIEIDEICEWKANCSASYISNFYRNQLKGDEPGLVAYFPMEETIVDQYEQNVTRFSLVDKQTNHPDWNINIYLRDGNGMVDAKETSTVPPICEQLPTEKVMHTYTSSERRIVINITEDARRIEGCTLNLTVRDIVDENGNYSAPINWSVYVNRNQLLWDEQNLNVVKKSLTDTTIQITIINNSGKAENWSLDNIPEWLTFNEYSGVLSPLSKKTLEATISSSLAIGTHRSTIYLTGNEGINQPLYVSVKVNATQPDWKINPADYEYSMNMIAVAFVNNRMTDDSEDMIAAFVNGELAGVGHPKLFPVYNQYLVMMDIYANLTEKQVASINRGDKIPVTFKLWDASSGITYNKLKIQSNATDDSQQTMAFVPGQLVGQPNNPVRLTAEKNVEQTISLTEGWNWISFNVLPDDNSFTSILGDIVENMSLIKSQVAFAQLYEEHRLVGSLEYEDLTKGYKVRMNKPCTLTVSGQVPNKINFTSLAANGWTWIGYLPQTTMSVNTALANLNPSVGDVIKARSGFATWDGYSWIGSLTTMSPGNGYLYYNSSENKSMFIYSSISTTELTPLLKSLSNSAFSPIEPSKYQSNMTVTAVVMNGEQIVEDAEVGIFVGDECRTAAVFQDGYWFITIPGEGNVELTIKVAIDGDIQTLKQTLTYVDDAMVGSPVEPYVIQLDETTGIENVGMESQNKGPRVFIEDGIVYIERDGKIYDLKGKFVKNYSSDMLPTISKHIRKQNK